MTEHSASFQQTDQAGNLIPERSDLSAAVTLNLPSDLALAIEQQRQQSGQPAIEVILNLLRSALDLPVTPSSTPQAAFKLTQNIAPEDFQSLLERLTQIEELIPRLEALEGKSIAF